jgi:spore maturation protein CgeB
LLTPEQEILIADSAEEVTDILARMPEERRRSIAAAARKRVLRNHTAEHRAKALEEFYREILDRDRAKRRIEAVA